MFLMNFFVVDELSRFQEYADRQVLNETHVTRRVGRPMKQRPVKQSSNDHVAGIEKEKPRLENARSVAPHGKVKTVSAAIRSDVMKVGSQEARLYSKEKLEETSVRRKRSSIEAPLRQSKKARKRNSISDMNQLSVDDHLSYGLHLPSIKGEAITMDHGSWYDWGELNLIWIRNPRPRPKLEDSTIAATGIGRTTSQSGSSLHHVVIDIDDGSENEEHWRTPQSSTERRMIPSEHPAFVTSPTSYGMVCQPTTPVLKVGINHSNVATPKKENTTAQNQRIDEEHDSRQNQMKKLHRTRYESFHSRHSRDAHVSATETMNKGLSLFSLSKFGPKKEDDPLNRIRSQGLMSQNLHTGGTGNTESPKPEDGEVLTATPVSRRARPVKKKKGENSLGTEKWVIGDLDSNMKSCVGIESHKIQSASPKKPRKSNRVSHSNRTPQPPNDDACDDIVIILDSVDETSSDVDSCPLTWSTVERLGQRDVDMGQRNVDMGQQRERSQTEIPLERISSGVSLPGEITSDGTMEVEGSNSSPKDRDSSIPTEILVGCNSTNNGLSHNDCPVNLGTLFIDDDIPMSETRDREDLSKEIRNSEQVPIDSTECTDNEMHEDEHRLSNDVSSSNIMDGDVHPHPVFNRPIPDVPDSSSFPPLRGDLQTLEPNLDEPSEFCPIPTSDLVPPLPAVCVIPSSICSLTLL